MSEIERPLDEEKEEEWETIKPKSSLAYLRYDKRFPKLYSRAAHKFYRGTSIVQ
jgi:hypothetical protein